MSKGPLHENFDHRFVHCSKDTINPSLYRLATWVMSSLRHHSKSARWDLLHPKPKKSSSIQFNPIFPKVSDHSHWGMLNGGSFCIQTLIFGVSTRQRERKFNYSSTIEFQDLKPTSNERWFSATTDSRHYPFQKSIQIRTKAKNTRKCNKYDSFRIVGSINFIQSLNLTFGNRSSGLNKTKESFQPPPNVQVQPTSHWAITTQIFAKLPMIT